MGPELSGDEMDLDFGDVDCGEWSPGHRFVARGLRQDGLSDSSMLADYSGHYPGKPVEPMVSVVYAIVPGLSAEELQAGHDIDPTVSLDPPADAQHWGDPVKMGGERCALPDTEETVGAFGPFVLPLQTRRITMELTPIHVTVAARPTGAGTHELMTSGRLTIDLHTQRASFAADPV